MPDSLQESPIPHAGKSFSLEDFFVYLAGNRATLEENGFSLAENRGPHVVLATFHHK